MCSDAKHHSWRNRVSLLIIVCAGTVLSIPMNAAAAHDQPELQVFRDSGSVSQDMFSSMTPSSDKDDRQPEEEKLLDVWDALKGYQCKVWGYGYVDVMNKPDLKNLSYAERIGSPPQYTLRIFVRSDLLKTFSLPTRLFWLEHECAHHTLGQTMDTQLPPLDRLGRDEVEADCRGIRGVQKLINNDHNEIATIVKEMKRMRGGQGYPAGYQRSACLQACLENPQLSEKDVAFSCY